MKHRAALLFITGAAFTLTAHAQEFSEEGLAKVSEMTPEELLLRDKLRLYDRMLGQSLSEDGTIAEKPNTQQLAALGRTDLVLQNLPETGWEFCEGGTIEEDPIAAIAEMADNTRIVIVNEAHDKPWHRDFVARLAVVLADKGYTSFAAETLANPMTQESAPDTPPYGLVAETYPGLTTGYYSNEPVFAREIRTIMENGYTLISYEINDLDFLMNPPDRSESIRIREEAQASNLAAFFDLLDPDEKLLVHVGYGHVEEVEIPNFDGSMTYWMAGRLKQKTGVDPVTVSQTICEKEGPASVLVNNVTNPRYDAVVAHPPIEFVNNRPAWRIAAGDIETDIPQAVLFEGEPTVVEAWEVDDPADAVPRDRILVMPGEDMHLLLPPGSYRVQGFALPEQFSQVVTIAITE